MDHVYCRQCRLIYRSIQRSIQRSTVGRPSVDTRSIVGRHSVDSGSIQRSIVGRHSVNSRSRCVSADVAFRSPTLRRLFADTSPIVGRYLTDVSVSNWSTLGRWSVDTWSIVRRQPLDILVESRPIVDRYIGRDFCRSVEMNVFSLLDILSPSSAHYQRVLSITDR